MELSIGRDFQFSTNVINPSSGIGFTPNTDLIDFAVSPFSQKGAILNFRQGKTTNITVAGKSVEISSVTGLIKALQTNSNANVLATPQILTLDNTEATFESSEKIPYPTATAVQGSVATSVAKESVSLTIKLKPQINKISNFVKLDIKAKLADISSRELPKQVQDLAFATIERNAETSIVVADKDTVVLGGLTRDKQEETVSKVPILGDIPLLGWLFKARRSQSSKTNLLLFITPTIIRQYESVRAVLDKKLKERDDFIESSAGGNDPLRKYRDNMIRTLPEIKDLTSVKPVTGFTIDQDEPQLEGNPSGATEPRQTP
jgi:general secretion pathway protein D